MNYQNSFLLVCIVLLLHSATARAEPQASNSEEPTFTVEQLREDFLVVRGCILEVHPGLYRFTDRRVVHQFFDDAWAALDRPLTELELFQILSPVNGVIKCGHTRMLPSRNTINQTLQEGRFLPLLRDDRRSTLLARKPIAA